MKKTNETANKQTQTNKYAEKSLRRRLASATLPHALGTGKSGATALPACDCPS
jgi:hypothetical protein